MIVVHLLRWEKGRAWTDWNDHLGKNSADRLPWACPSLRLSERKRLTRKIGAGAVLKIVVENPKDAESLSHILEATGAVVSMAAEESGPSAEPTPDPRTNST